MKALSFYLIVQNSVCGNHDVRNSVLCKCFSRIGHPVDDLESKTALILPNDLHNDYSIEMAR
jgi:hypothetical protein